MNKTELWLNNIVVL